MNIYCSKNLEFICSLIQAKFILFCDWISNPKSSHRPNQLHLPITIDISSRQTSLSNTIHLHDFVDAVKDDPSRPNSCNYVEILTAINLFQEDDFYSANIIVKLIHIYICTYLN